MQDERTAVITGASSGIGLETAKALAKEGWRIIAVGRDPQRSEAALGAIRATSGNERAEMLLCDLSLMSEVSRLAQQISERTERVDILINNAGGTSRARAMTSEGNEATFAGNYLGHFLLTKLLLPLLERTAQRGAHGQTRIVNVSSMASEASEGLNWADIQSIEAFEVDKAYNNVKLANILHTRALTKRLEASGIVAHCMHPGIVATNFVNHGNEAMRQTFIDYAEIVVPPEAGADTLIWLALDDEPGRSSGGYFFQRAHTPMPRLGEDDAAAERLWQESEALTASIRDTQA